MPELKKGRLKPFPLIGTIKTIFPLLAFRSPLRARETPGCPSRLDGMVGEPHSFKNLTFSGYLAYF
jgi:hypothetical protein